ncbi:MAG: hypothetical protein ACOCVP_02460, partial [Wenzhouxiangella sp.]
HHQQQALRNVTAAFRRAYEGAGHSGNWLSVSATLDEASIRLHQARPRDALRILERYSDDEVQALSVYWRCRMLRARAAVHAALGRDRDALDLFAEANRLEAEGG